MWSTAQYLKCNCMWFASEHEKYENYLLAIIFSLKNILLLKTKYSVAELYLYWIILHWIFRFKYFMYETDLIGNLIIISNILYYYIIL